MKKKSKSILFLKSTKYRFNSVLFTVWFAFLFQLFSFCFFHSLPVEFRFSLHLYLCVFWICFYVYFFCCCCCCKLVKPRWNSCVEAHIPEKKVMFRFCMSFFLLLLFRLLCCVCFIALLCFFFHDYEN